MPEIIDAELDAATNAYVGMRWPDVADWRERYPQAWNEIRANMNAALIAAARVRADGHPES
jgi:hypothetical protein